MYSNNQIYKALQLVLISIAFIREIKVHNSLYVCILLALYVKRSKGRIWIHSLIRHSPGSFLSNIVYYQGVGLTICYIYESVPAFSRGIANVNGRRYQDRPGLYLTTRDFIPVQKFILQNVKMKMLYLSFGVWVKLTVRKSNARIWGGHTCSSSNLPVSSIHNLPHSSI